jgi:PAS domain-containing protein
MLRFGDDDLKCGVNHNMDDMQLDPASRISIPGSLRKLPLGIALVWTMVISASLLFNIELSKQKTIDLVHQQGETLLNKDRALRFWIARHGGLYVPVSARTPPNPALEHIAERDIVTPGGRQLTLMNPAYAIRELNEDYEELNGIVGHITSKKLLREENAPDQWELDALDKFENGVVTVEEVTSLNGMPYLRIMRSMVIEKNCLKCHGHQDYEVGDVRGGIAIAVPMAPYLVASADQIQIMIIGHLLIWVLGLTGIWFAQRRIFQNQLSRIKAEENLRNSELDMEQIWNQLPIGVALIDRKKKIKMINPMALEILGLENNSPLGCDCTAGLCVSKTCPVWDSETPGGKPESLITNMLYPGKTIEKTFVPVVMNGEQVMLELISDITEQATANEVVLKNVNDLEQFNRLAVGRETRMIELKQEINLLLVELGRSQKYQPDREVYETT